MRKIKYKYRTLSDKLTMLYPLVKSYKKSYHENRKFLKIKMKILIYIKWNWQ